MSPSQFCQTLCGAWGYTRSCAGPQFPYPQALGWYRWLLNLRVRVSVNASSSWGSLASGPPAQLPPPPHYVPTSWTQVRAVAISRGMALGTAAGMDTRHCGFCNTRSDPEQRWVAGSPRPQDSLGVAEGTGPSQPCARRLPTSQTLAHEETKLRGEFTRRALTT